MNNTPMDDFYYFVGTSERNLTDATSVEYYDDVYYEYYGATNSSNRTFYEPSFSSIDYFTFVFLSLQVVIGLAGNSMAFIVWTMGKECSNIACSTYFKLLTITDTFALIFCGMCYVVLESLRLIDIPSLTMCMGLEFLSMYAPQLSTWLIVCISVERVLSLTFPFSFVPTRAKTRAKVAFLVLILVLTGINCRAFMKILDGYGCNTRDDHIIVYELMLEVSSVWTLCVVPFFLIISCNAVILIQLCLMKRTNAMKRQRSRRLAMFTKFSIASGVLQTISLFPTMLKYLFVSYKITNFAPTLIILHFTARNTLYLNNSLNFLVFWLSSTQYRSDIRRIFFGNNAYLRNQRTSQVTSE